ncbi:MAG: hypothetical protein M9894_29395 [Planctomycetes bacterium]|nr:hypothetical protein [Planctomycetota bacterium]
MSRLRALALAPLLLLAGCGCVRYRALQVDTRARLEERRTATVLATRLVEGDAFADAPAAVLPLAEHYRPGEGEWTVGRVEDAPEPLQAALRAARVALLERGYELARGDAAPDLVVLVSVTHDRRGDLRRVAVDVGGALDDRFERALVSLDAVLDEGCEREVDDLVRALLGALPERADPEAP